MHEYHINRFSITNILVLIPESKRQQQRESIVQHLNQSQRPLVYFPEGWDTNGTGLLIYQKFLFSLGLTVLPVALKVNVLGLPLVPGKLGSSIFKEIAWMFFSPLYIYDIELLEPTVRFIFNNISLLMLLIHHCDRPKQRRKIPISLPIACNTLSRIIWAL
jgi:1-acyl-sn-glycerol-3-phosphate acyltransferase